MWYIVSPVVVARSTLKRPNRDWRWDRRNTRMSERGMMEKSTVEEYTCESHYPIDWEETTALDHGRGQELLVKEAWHIQMTPSEECFNRDGGLEVPGCLTAVMRRQGERSNSHQHLTSDDVVCFSLRECLKLHRLGQKLKVNCTKRQCFQEGSITFWIRSAHLCMRYVAVFIFWSPQCSWWDLVLAETCPV